MATPTRGAGDTGKTVFHFFINNGQRYMGMPGFMHTPIDNGIFDAIKSVVTSADIPCGELGETDTRLYGIQLRDSREIPGVVWGHDINDVDNRGASPAGLVMGTMAWRVVDLVSKVDNIWNKDVADVEGIHGPAPAGLVLGTMARRIVELTAVVEQIAAKLNIEPPPPVDLTKTHTVQQGDTLSSIAKANGVSKEQLAEWNKLADPNNISIGQVLRLGP